MSGVLREFKADLHIHSCLSPCASLDLSPRRIVEKAKAMDLDLIAITDHNTAKNVMPVMRMAERRSLQVIPGMEVQTREEIHLLTLFPDWPSLAAWEEVVRRRLPNLKNDPDLLGDQPVVDEEGNILEFEERLLLNSLDLSLKEITNQVTEMGGLFIPAHFDKESYSLISQLGFIPEGLKPEALEVSRKRQPALPAEFFPPAPSIPKIACSDAHHLEDIGRAQTVFLLAEPTLAELRLALRGEGGRRLRSLVFQDPRTDLKMP